MADSWSPSGHTVAVYRTHDQAEGAVKFLKNCGHEVEHLIIIGQDEILANAHHKSGDEATPVSDTTLVAAALANFGLPAGSVHRYEEALKAGRFLLLVRGHKSEGQRAKAALASTPATSIEHFSTKVSEEIGGPAPYGSSPVTFPFLDIEPETNTGQVS